MTAVSVKRSIREIFPVESGILCFGMRNTAQGIRNPSATNEQRIQNPQHGNQNPRLSWMLLHGAIYIKKQKYCRLFIKLSLSGAKERKVTYYAYKKSKKSTEQQREVGLRGSFPVF